MGLPKRRTIKRRDFLANVASVPLLGTHRENREKNKGITGPGPLKKSDPVRLGIIGFGNRGEELVSESGLDDLNIEFRGVCEIFDQRMERGLNRAGPTARAYNHYIDLLERDDIEAVIIATPDHWHARIAIEAASRGKHIYLEKCMTRTVGEAKALKDAVKKSGVVFQLGHQGRQRDLNHKARELITHGTLGEITLVETTTNRNDSLSGWTIPFDEMASKDSIDWDQFQEPAEVKVPFSKERYYGWRKYWDYGTGMSGDLLTNEFDTMNMIMDLGIPEYAIATGGLYSHRDGREVPNVFNASFEYPGKELTLLYSGTLASGIPRGTLVMGREATLELGRILSVWVDKQSIKYKSRIESGIIDPSSPLVNYLKHLDSVDAVSSATSKYFADRGLDMTYSGGNRVSTTHLHLAEWLRCIRTGSNTSCNIERGFEEAIVAHMATISYLEGRKVRWDAGTESII
jgi:predicted dehydrogenase